MFTNAKINANLFYIELNNQVALGLVHDYDEMDADQRDDGNGRQCRSAEYKNAGWDLGRYCDRE